VALPNPAPDPDSTSDLNPAQAHICPDCGSGNIDRTRRTKKVDYLVRFFGWRVYRCHDCRRRFYDIPSASRRGTY